MKHKLLVIILFVFSGIPFSEAQVLSCDSLCKEFRYFVKLLEETHPDPYSEYGGKIEFHKLAFEAEESLKSGDYTLSRYQDILSSFISGLHDGHTSVNITLEPNAPRYISIMLKTIPDGMIIKGLPSKDAQYLGSRIISIEGMTLDSLRAGISKMLPNENKYGEYRKLEKMIYYPTLLFRLFHELERKESIVVRVQTPENTIKEISVPVTGNKEWDKVDFVQLPKQSNLSKDEYLYYAPADGMHAMYLRMKSVMSRENFLVMQQQKWPSFQSQLKSFYQWTLRKEMPQDVDKALAELPCFAEVFRNMLSDMKENNIPHLIIDLRDNGGGWTPITLPALYMMYGDEYLDKDMETNSYRMISPLYMRKIGSTLDDFNQKYNSNYSYGDYIFNKPSGKKLTREEKRKRFVDNVIGDGGNYINDLNGKPLYTPKKVYVLTDAGTFSAAFHYAFYLWKMGAVVVGVPSPQAPNTYMEITEFELPYTKTKGSISNSAQYFLPPTDKRAKIFWPDMMPEYKDYKKYNFDQDAEILWLIDRINNK